MKKIILAVVLVVVVSTMALLFTGCTNSVTPYAAWADEETLVYSITDTSTKEAKGNMTVKTVRSPSDKTIGEKTYSSADGKVTMDLEMTGKYTLHTEFLTARYTVLAIKKVYTDLVDESKNYVFFAHHSGKYYYYSKNGVDGEIKVGTSYTDSEYLYHFIRCYPLSSPPTGFSIADATDGTVKKITCTAYANEKLTVPYPSGNKDVTCTVVAISLSDKPQGASIYASFTPDSADYYMTGLSISPSKKMPVKIVENDLTYTVTSMSVK